MSLFQASLVSGFFLSVVGLFLLSPKASVRTFIIDFPRSKKWSILFIAFATAWFLWRHVAFLGEADFGDYKVLIGGIALTTAILSFYFTPDFLAVRGLAMVLLLWSREVLDTAFLHTSYSRLVLVSVIYLLIITSLYFGAWPYKMRDCLGWFYKESLRMKCFGGILSLTGLLITFLSFIY